MRNFAVEAPTGPPGAGTTSPIVPEILPRMDSPPRIVGDESATAVHPSWGSHKIAFNRSAYLIASTQSIYHGLDSRLSSMARVPAQGKIPTLPGRSSILRIRTDPATVQVFLTS